jgi:hypothetical protein
MGALRKPRLTSAPLALALLFALASSTSSASSTTATGEPSEGGAGASRAEQSAASVTSVSSASAEAEAAAPEPAVRVAATRRMANPITRVEVPNVLLRAYRSAAAEVPAACHLPVSLLAAIGEVESGSLVGRQLDAEHRTSILGPVLDGKGFAAVADTDDGKLDGDTRWDRAMGPMQFIPSTWSTFGVDGDHDGVADPQDVEDAAAATAAYLCYGGRDLSDPADLGSAILAYNHSASYQRLVLTYQQRYSRLGLDRGTDVVGLSTPVDLVTADSLGAIQAAPERHVKRPATRRQPAAGTHRTHPARDAAPARKPAKKPSESSAKSPAKGPAKSPSADPTVAAGKPSPSPSGTPKPTPSGTPKPTPTPTPTPSPTPTPTPSPTPSPSPSPTPTDPATGCPLPEDLTTESGAPVDPASYPECPPCPTTDGATPTAAPTGSADEPVLCLPPVPEADGTTTP